MPAGRPTTYRPEYCERAIELGALGKSPAQIAANFDCSRQTLNDWAEANPEFSEALKKAHAKAQDWWEDVGQNALYADKFQPTVWAKSMQARFREDYTERRELGGMDGQQLKVTVMVLREDDE